MELLSEYVKQNGTRRGAFKYIAQELYPDVFMDDPKYAIKLVYEHYRYARKRMGKGFWNNGFGVSGADFGISDSVVHNMNYYVNNHSGMVYENEFSKESKDNRRLFELKKLLFAVLEDLIKPKSTLQSYINQYINDPRVVSIVNGLDSNIWYNGKHYVKLDKKAGALVYIIVHRIYVKHFGSGNKPQKLIKQFFEITGYAPRDLENELKELLPVFWDWFLFLDP